MLAQTIIGLAYSMNIGVIAEGVETEARRQRLFDYGCNTYQGYLFGRPLPADLLVFDLATNSDASATVIQLDATPDK